MGTDINFYIEKKIGGKWQKTDFPDRLLPWDRNQRVFGIFGQEQYQHDNFLPEHICFSERWIPDDSSYPEDNRKNGYGYTYAYLDELFQINWKYQDEDDNGNIYFPMNDCYFKSLVMHILPQWFNSYNSAGLRDIRLIVWFDN